jgi:hypothetical protein
VPTVEGRTRSWLQSGFDLRTTPVGLFEPDRLVRTQAKKQLLSTEPVGLEPAYRVALLSKRLRQRFDEHPWAVGALRDLAWMQIVEDFRNELKTIKLSLTILRTTPRDIPSYIRSDLGSVSIGSSGKPEPNRRASSR